MTTRVLLEGIYSLPLQICDRGQRFFDTMKK